jgi:hypothetical protein
MLWFIGKAMSAAERLFHQRHSFPELAAGRRFSRSERREAIVRVVKCLLYFMDLVTLRVALSRADERCVGLTETSIARWTGLSLWRVERALADLRAAGFLRSVQARVVKDGRYFGLAAIRTFSASFFARLGLGTTLVLERKRIYKHRLAVARSCGRRPPGPGHAGVA